MSGMLLGLSVSASALAWRPVGRLYMGITTPASPQWFKSAHLSGFTVGGCIGKELGERSDLMLDIGYSSFALNVQGYLATLDLSAADEVESSATGGDAAILTLYLHFKAKFPPPGDQRFVPYLFTEGGLFRYDQDEIQYWGPIGKDMTEAGAHSTVLGGGAGIGMEIAIEEHSTLFVDFGIKAGLTPNHSTIFFPFRLGVSLH
jgi:hypothetical protein